jgi:hypothetical protein
MPAAFSRRYTNILWRCHVQQQSTAVCGPGRYRARIAVVLAALFGAAALAAGVPATAQAAGDDRRSPAEAAATLAAKAKSAGTPTTAGVPQVTPAVSCYGGAVNVSWVEYAEFGEYITTSRCRDINMRTTNGKYAWACVVFVRHTRDCNYATRVGPSWTTIATDVRDGTRFIVPALSEVKNDYVTAQIAF